MDPLSHYGGYSMPATERFLDGFLPWLADEAGTPTRRAPDTPPPRVNSG
ncbi:MAG TPA: hypothetical protein VH008_10155 [Pseudonocardia sp.]|nr:hypothetical protein [Pseudonocardia sp.]